MLPIAFSPAVRLCRSSPQAPGASRRAGTPIANAAAATARSDTTTASAQAEARPTEALAINASATAPATPAPTASAARPTGGSATRAIHWVAANAASAAKAPSRTAIESRGCERVARRGSPMAAGQGRSEPLAPAVAAEAWFTPPPIVPAGRLRGAVRGSPRP